MYRLIIATVLLAIILLVLMLRRGSPLRTRDIKIASRASLHRGAYVAVVEVDGRRLLLGIGQQVTYLAELEPTPPPPVLEDAERPSATAQPAPSVLPADASVSMLEKIRRATTRSARGPQ